jgi:hypothetical protein
MGARSDLAVDLLKGVGVGGGAIAHAGLLELGVLDEGVGERLDHWDHARRIGPDVRILVQQGRVLRCGEHRCAGIGGLVDGVLQAVLEALAVDHHQRRVRHRLHLAGRRSELVGIGADREQDLDLGSVADDLAHDVAQDRGRHHDRRPVVARALGVAARRQDRGGGDPDTEN